MRRSSVIRLSLLPLLASATIVNAQGAPGSEPDPAQGPPGMMEPRELSPPGLTAPAQPCPEGESRPDCTQTRYIGSYWTVRGGFGGYFWTGGG